MNFLRKIFGQQSRSGKSETTGPKPGTIEQIQEDTQKLWSLLKETVVFYNSVACPCAFPRFIQYTNIDCVDTSTSFYMSETEGFIQMSRDCFEHYEVAKDDECFKEICTCKTCGSTFVRAWSDFSIHVNRTYLKPLELKAKQVGADKEEVIPFFIGLFGHSYPDGAKFRHVSYEEFKNYIQALTARSAEIT